VAVAAFAHDLMPQSAAAGRTAAARTTAARLMRAVACGSPGADGGLEEDLLSISKQQPSSSIRNVAATPQMSEFLHMLSFFFTILIDL
jgi:hypothetical protein